MFLVWDAAARARISTESCLYAAVLMSIRSTTLLVLNISSNPGNTGPASPPPVLANFASCMAWTIFSADHLPAIACLATSLMIASSTPSAEPSATALEVAKSPVAVLSNNH